MTGNATQRSATFRAAYWERAEQLAPLVVASQRGKLAQTTRDALGRRAAKRFIGAASDNGVLSLEELDSVCKRYALWVVRSRWDWGKHEAPWLDDSVRTLDDGLTGGIWNLDVVLRRDVETLLLSGHRDAARAEHLRSLVEARAGQVAATIAASRLSDRTHTHWDEIEAQFDGVCNSLDSLLTVAGAPRTDP